MAPDFLQVLTRKHKNYFPLSQKELQRLKVGGTRIRPNSKQKKFSTPPFLSIVTVNKNRVEDLKNTIESVLSQSYRDKELLIIDGGSEEKSIEVIRKYEKNIAFWLSYNDQGIYDAMNRGTLLSRGTWLLFLNAGDCFYDSESLSKLLSYCEEEEELVYGNHEVRYIDKNFRRIHFARSIRSHYDLWHHMGFCHQSLIARRELQKQNLFDNGNLSADYKFVLSSFVAGHKIRRVPVIVASVDTAGVSQRRRIYMEIERWKISREVAPRVWTDLGFLWILCSTSLRVFIQKLLGRRITRRILELKYAKREKE